MKIQHPPTPLQRDQIRLTIELAGLSNKDLAVKAKVSTSELSAIKGGYGNSRPALEAVCAVLGLEVAK